jgi:hypothetical protein
MASRRAGEASGLRITLSMYWSGVSPVEVITSSISWVRLLSVPAVRPPVLKPYAMSDLSNFFYFRPAYGLKRWHTKQQSAAGALVMAHQQSGYSLRQSFLDNQKIAAHFKRCTRSYS